MDQEKIGNFIKELRLKNNNTQKEFADSLGVTFQAVSKWENGKNIPDIQILTEICNIYNVDISEILSTPTTKIEKNNNKILYIIIAVITLLLIAMGIIFMVLKNKNDDITLKNLSTTCNNFKISGSAAFTQNKTSLNINDIEFCGEEDKTVYKELECNLYETYNNTDSLVSSCDKDTNKTLEEYLKDMEIKVHNYNTVCSNANNTSLYLQISVKDSDSKTINYKIPIKLENSCH